MNGSTRRRGKVWEYVADLGQRTRWACSADGCRWGSWSAVDARDGCPRHPDAPVAETARRRQVTRSGFARKRDAEAALREALAEVDAVGTVAPSRLTLGVYMVDEWLPAIGNVVKPTTAAQYRQLATKHIVPRLGPVAIRELEPAHLDRLYADLLADGRRDGSGGLAPKTVRHVHVVLRKALGDAVRKGRASRNVAELACPPRPAKPPLRVWSAGQVRAFLDVAVDHRLAAAWVLCATTGMNRGELLGLRWDDVDLADATVVVARQVTLADGQPVASTAKTDNRRRTISLDAGTVAALREHAARQADEMAAAGSAWQDSSLVFAREDGSPIHPERLSRQFRTLCRRAHVEHIGLHGVRHTYATLALASGVPVKVVSERLGHASTSITMDIYQHVMPGMDRDAADHVARLIGVL